VDSAWPVCTSRRVRLSEGPLRGALVSCPLLPAVDEEKHEHQNEEVPKRVANVQHLRAPGVW